MSRHDALLQFFIEQWISDQSKCVAVPIVFRREVPTKKRYIFVLSSTGSRPPEKLLDLDLELLS